MRRVIRNSAVTTTLLVGAILNLTGVPYLGYIFENGQESLPFSVIIQAHKRIARPTGVKSKLQTFSYEVQRGDSLLRIWDINGAPRNGALSAAQAIKELALPVKHYLKPGERLDLTKTPDGDIINYAQYLSNGSILRLVGNSFTGYRGVLLQPVVREEAITMRGIIRRSFVQEALNVSIPYDTIDQVVDLLADRIEFNRSLHPGDSFVISYLRRTNSFGRILPVNPVDSASIKTGGKLVAAIQYSSADGKARYYNQNGGVIDRSFLRYPLQFTRISSVFSKSRFHPILAQRRPHNGVDFAAPIGTPVRAVADGIVVISGYHGASGKMIKIKHDERYSSAYLHLSKIAAGVKNGQRVTRGQYIGAVGQTGLATGPHLHYSLYENGHYVDPFKVHALLNGSADSVPIPPNFLKARLERLTEMHDGPVPKV